MKHLPIWYMGQLPPEVCDHASEAYMKIEPKDAVMGQDGELLAHNYRNTTVRFGTKEDWFADILKCFAAEANENTGWKYEVTDQETVQHAVYGVGQHYNWHVDNFPLTTKDTDRKLTVVCLLNDPSEFDGGEFQMRLYQEYTAPLVKGSIIAFPSILEHRVTPVTRGVRMSATIWLSGPRFK